MTEFLQTLFAGLAQGTMYALIAIGFVIVYRATGVLNFTTGGLLMFGAYLAQRAVQAWGLPFAVAMVVGVVAPGCLRWPSSPWSCHAWRASRTSR